MTDTVGLAARISEVFQRLRGRDECSGSGIEPAIVERHGGQIFVESNPEPGSRFIFTLPGGGPAKEDAL